MVLAALDGEPGIHAARALEFRSLQLGEQAVRTPLAETFEGSASGDAAQPRWKTCPEAQAADAAEGQQERVLCRVESIVGVAGDAQADPVDEILVAVVEHPERCVPARHVPLLASEDERVVGVVKAFHRTEPRLRAAGAQP